MLTAQQSRAVELALDGHNVVITGGIRCGKTLTICEVIARLKAAGKNVAVTASTGLASQQIKGLYLWGFVITIHVVNDWR